MEREWSEKYAMLSRLLTYMEKIKELNERAEHERDPLCLWHLMEDADGIRLAVQARLLFTIKRKINIKSIFLGLKVTNRCGTCIKCASPVQVTQKTIK